MSNLLQASFQLFIVKSSWRKVEPGLVCWFIAESVCSYSAKHADVLTMIDSGAQLTVGTLYSLNPMILLKHFSSFFTHHHLHDSLCFTKNSKDWLFSRIICHLQFKNTITSFLHYFYKVLPFWWYWWGCWNVDEMLIECCEVAGADWVQWRNDTMWYGNNESIGGTSAPTLHCVTSKI